MSRAAALAVRVVAALCGVSMLVPGLWALLAPGSFARTLHALNHTEDLHLGGHPGDRWELAALDALALAALVVHLRRRRPAVAEGERP